MGGGEWEGRGAFRRLQSAEILHRYITYGYFHTLSCSGPIIYFAAVIKPKLESKHFVFTKLSSSSVMRHDCWLFL